MYEHNTYALVVACRDQRGNQACYSNHCLLYSCDKSLSLNLEPGWQPADASNPCVSTPYRVGVTGFQGFELRALCLHRKCSSYFLPHCDIFIYVHNGYNDTHCPLLSYLPPASAAPLFPPSESFFHFSLS